MQKYKAKREVVEQITSKLKLSENNELSTKKVDSNTKNAQKQAKSDLLEGINVESSKLQANNIEKSNHEGCVLKDYFVNGHHQRHWVKIGTDEIVADDYKEHEFKPSETRKIHYLAKITKDLLKPYVGTMFHNKNVPGIDDFKSPFSMNSIQKLTSDKAVTKTVVNGFSIEEHFEAAQNIKEIFENSDYVGTFSDDKHIENVIDIKRFQKKINLSTGKKAYAYITIKNTVQQSDKLYSVELILKKYPSSMNDNGVHQGITKSNASNNYIIQDDTYLSIKPLKKSLTYSGHKLQGRTKLYGMDISIENKKGSYRSGVDSDGHKWKCLMHYDYGYIRGTVGTDGDHLDVYVGPAKDSNKVYVIHQNNPVTHKYDEDKCMLCFESADAAKKAYMKQYDRPGFFGSMDILTVDEFKSYVFSKKGKRIHKSFDITVTDITENNKHKKIEQVEKALNAIYDNKPFVIRHIKTDNSKHYNDITLRIRDFDKNKIQKAVHKMAFSLDTQIKSAKGEAFIYRAQEELTDRIVSELTEKTKSVYSFLISYFGLPEVRIISKADLKYKGKVLYDPETGKPISQAEWKKFVTAIEKFLNRNYTGVGKKIVLSAESLGRILERLSKTNSFEAIQKMPLSGLKYGGKTFDWISSDIKNMQNTFGESIDRMTQARIQVAVDSAAQKITKVTDNMRNDIQQIIIDGIKDRQSKAKISQNLFDKCSGLNRDFQRIADTEIQNNANNAYIKEELFNTPENEKVYFTRFEQVDDNTCKKCRAIEGKLALWSDIPLESERIKDPYADYAIWEGKTDGTMPVSVMHPYCRGCWVRYYPEIK